MRQTWHKYANTDANDYFTYKKDIFITSLLCSVPHGKINDFHLLQLICIVCILSDVKIVILWLTQCLALDIGLSKLCTIFLWLLTRKHQNTRYLLLFLFSKWEIIIIDKSNSKFKISPLDAYLDVSWFYAFYNFS